MVGRIGTDVEPHTAQRTGDLETDGLLFTHRSVKLVIDRRTDGFGEDLPIVLPQEVIK
jgi:hypothetical protein